MERHDAGSPDDRPRVDDRSNGSKELESSVPDFAEPRGPCNHSQADSFCPHAPRDRDHVSETCCGSPACSAATIVAAEQELALVYSSRDDLA